MIGAAFGGLAAGAVGVDVDGTCARSVAGFAMLTAAAAMFCGATAAAAVAGLIGAAVMTDPTTVFARAVGVLSLPTVDAIGVEPSVTTLAALGAGTPTSVFFGGTGLNESRIFSAAAQSCERM